MKNIKTMTRWEIIQELRRHAHPSWFHALLDRTTPALRALLFYYENGGPAENEGSARAGGGRIVIYYKGVRASFPAISVPKGGK